MATYTHTRLLVVLGLLASVPGCAQADSSDDDAQAGAMTATSRVDRAIRSFESASDQLVGAGWISAEDAALRREACLRSTALDRIANAVDPSIRPLQRAYYCAMPLEFRVCLTPLLMGLDEPTIPEGADPTDTKVAADVATRSAHRALAFFKCNASTVPAAIGSPGTLTFGKVGDAPMQTIFGDLVGDGESWLEEAEARRLAAAHTPRVTNVDDETLRKKVDASLRREVKGRSPAFKALVDAYIAAGMP